MASLAESPMPGPSLTVRDYLTFLITYLASQSARLLVLAVCLLAGIGLQLTTPQIMRFFVDSALTGGSLDGLIGAALLVIAIALLTQLAAVTATYLAEQVGWNSTNTLRADLATHLLRLDLAFHKTRPPGELIERVDGDVSALANFFSQFVLHLLGNFLLLFGVLIALGREDLRLGLAFGLFTVIALTALLPLRSWAVGAWTADRQARASFYGFLGEHLAGTEDLRANGATAYVLYRFDSLIQRWFPISVRAEMAHAGIWLAGNMVYIVGLLLAAGASILLWQAGSITIGAVLLIFSYTDMMRRPIDQLRGQLQELQKAGASIIRVKELFQAQPSILDGSGGPLPAGALPLAFENCSFHYEEDEPVLDALTFQLPAGRVLGLLGRTGSGKTTLTRLILRFYEPAAGTIRLAGQPLPNLPLAELRRRVGLVTQEVQLFEASVRDNLTFFDPAIDDERILATLKDLGLMTWLQELPNGLDTELSAGGGLSAGEAQLLAFARIFLRDPGLVILDEASSRLDPATEQLIERAIDRLLVDRTAIIIAHRLATVLRADEILVLDQGHILEHGERERLAAEPTSRFAQLLRTGGLEEVLV